MMAGYPDLYVGAKTSLAVDLADIEVGGANDAWGRDVDHLSNQPQLQARLVDCDFCIELKLRTQYPLSRRGTDRIVYETPNFAVLVDISPIAVGHMLIISKFHYLSMAKAWQKHAAELEKLIIDVAPLYAELFGALTIVEHGSSADLSGLSACITHAHMHLLPFDSELSTPYRHDFTELHRRPLSRSAASSWIASPYIMLWSHYESSFVEIVSQPPYKHYARSLVGRIAGMPAAEWDWGVVSQSANFQRTMVSAGQLRRRLSSL